jgi:hypothetical protein
MLKKPGGNIDAETGEADTRNKIVIDDGVKSHPGMETKEPESEFVKVAIEGTKNEAVNDDK